MEYGSTLVQISPVFILANIYYPSIYSKDQVTFSNHALVPFIISFFQPLLQFLTFPADSSK